MVLDGGKGPTFSKEEEVIFVCDYNIIEGLIVSFWVLSDRDMRTDKY